MNLVMEKSRRCDEAGIGVEINNFMLESRGLKYTCRARLINKALNL